MAQGLDELDHRLIELLRINARLPVVKLAQALGVSRTTVQARLKALEASAAITGYTVSTAVQREKKIRAMVLISIDSKVEIDVAKALSRRHEIAVLYSISGKYDLCALLSTDTTDELDQTIDRIRAVRGVLDTFSTVILSTKLNRPE